MQVELLRDVLAWCALINYVVIIIWWLIFSLAHDWIFGLHSRWFRIARERYDAIHMVSLAFYKICIFVFNLVPYLVLRALI